MKSLFKTSNLLGTLMLIFIIAFSSYFIYSLIDSSLNADSSINSNQVWCSNCQTYHDRETAEKENQKLIWCVNCKTFHAPDKDE